MTPISSRHALVFIFVVVLLDAIGFGIVMPVLPQLITRITGASLGEAARYGGWLGFAYAVMQFLFGPIVGALSDRFGRRPVLLASLVAFGLDYAFCGLSPSLTWLFVGRILAGITGASYSTANAYLADVTPPEKRAQSFGLMGAAFGIGLIVGPVIGGALGGFGPRAPFFAASGLALLNFVYGACFMKESLGSEARRKFQPGRANPLSVLTRLRRQRPDVYSFAIVLFLFQLAGQSIMIWSYYVTERFHWTTQQIGLSLAAVGVTAIVVQGGLIRVIVPRLGEYRAALVGLWATATSLFVYGFARSGGAIYAGIAVSALGDLAYPSIEALMSQRMEADAQGELQGAIVSFTSLATIIGPIAFSQLFAVSSGSSSIYYLPGASFGCGGALTLVALVVFRSTSARSINTH